MKTKVLSILFMAVVTLPAVAQKQLQNRTANNTQSTTLPRPKLVVGLVVDQMRWDYLYRFYDRYGTGGFKRFLREGFTFENTYINYIPTKTAIGHASVYTGSVPAIHGMAGNDFIIQSTGRNMYCVEDSSVQTVGSNSSAGKMSPRNLLASTITDELKLATNFRSKVIGISLKDRGGILPAGHLANGAYWFDDRSGNWISSTFYMKDLPQWVKDFNAQKKAEKYLAQDWNTLYPVGSYVQSLADSNGYEGKFKGVTTSSFPVKTSALLALNGVGLIRTTPFGNSFTLDLARAAIDNEQMGQGAVTDFLAVSLSSTDYIGHQFAPNAVEIEDTYLRLDKDIEAFFQYLDKKVGKGAYTVFLTADHGGAHNPRMLMDKQMQAGLWPEAKLKNDLNAALEKEFGVKNMVLGFNNYQVHFAPGTLAVEKPNKATLKRYCIEFLEKQAGVAFVADMENLQGAAIPELLKTSIINGYNRERSGPLQIILKPGWYSGSATATGSNHGVWNPYDAHIPLLFVGWGINQGKSTATANITDIAPTLAALLHIQAPNGCIGKTLDGVLK